jgi:hypothetical protein
MPRLITLALALTCAACGFGRDVGQSAGYEIIPNTHVTDTALYPLSSLLLIEHDLRLEQTRLYLFTGDLRGADLGLEDLRRVALRFSSFAMAFDSPIARVQVDADADLDAGVAGDEDAGPIVSHGTALMALVGARTVPLVRLDDTGLFRSYASRYLTSVSSPDYDVAAYFGVTDAPATLPQVSIPSLGMRFTPNLASAELKLVQNEMLLGLTYTSAADYLTFELVQEKRRASDGSEVDALVRTLLAPGIPYGLSARLVNDVAGQGCWSSDRPIEARVHQVVRSYQLRAPRAPGDSAVSYERIEKLEIAPPRWTVLLGPARPSPYCDQLR